MTTRYILSVPYDSDRIDFAVRLAELAHVHVSRNGPQRRVQISLDSNRMADVRKALPSYVRIEPIIPHRATDCEDAALVSH